MTDHMDPFLKAYVDRVVEEAPQVKAEWAELEPTIEWHCPGRHGVIRDVPREKAARVERLIEWHFGSKACRWSEKSAKGTMSVEFVHMTKVFPPPKKPWEWCGTTVLFPEWKAQEDEIRAAAADFTPGQAVWFDHGGRKDGFISKINRQTIGVTVPGEGEWRVPPTQLHAREA